MEAMWKIYFTKQMILDGYIKGGREQNIMIGQV